ncbi:MAG: hypothetical protein JXA09_07105, partial [Anaerolineae bacterium]|nr:hypothetical protein [Anaerolineae bacterium]
MKTRRTGSLLLVGLLAAAATLLLTAGLAAAQPEAGTPPLLSPDDVSLPRVADDPARTVAEQAQPGWAKWVNGVSWKPGMTITVETSDTIEIVDAVTTLPSEPLDLAETWDHLHLKLLGYQVQAPFPGWAVITDTGALVWQLPEGGQVFTMTKWFHVEPCTWGETELVETLSGASQSTVRPVIIEKRAPMLWIGSEYQPGVIAGEGAQFALRYGNDGGYENGVWVRNEFPPEAPFAWSDPPPDEGGAGDFSVGWRVGDLAMGSTGEIVVGVSITAGLPVSTEIPTWDCILDHTGEPRDEVISVFHVQETPPQVVWHKLVNDVPWDPELLVTAVTSDTIEVVDLVEILIPTAFTLIEEWDPAHLELLDAIPSLGKVVTGMGTLEWTVPEPFESPITAELVKRFHVGPGPWDATVLEEALIVPGAEPMVRVVPIAHRYPPVVFPEGPWPWYAQDEISVYPEPPLAGQPTEICAQVVNVDPLHAHWALLEFAIADFGIGLPFEAIDAVEVIVPPGGEATGCIVWVPPEPRKWCIEVRLINEGFEPLISRRNVDADEPLMPNMPHELIFPVANPLGEMVTIDLFMVPHIDWGMAISPTKLVNIEPGETRPVSLIVTPTENMPADGHPVVDVEARVGDELIGGFRKLFRPLIVLHPFPDPPYAEREISVHPYPPLAGQPTEVCVELRNPTPYAQDVAVQFSWAAFGIGIPFTPIDGLRPVY